MTTLFCLLLSALIFLTAPWLMQIFISSDEKEIIRIGVEYLRVEGSFYLGIGYLFLWYGFYRAICKPHLSIILTILSLGTRVALAYFWHLFLPLAYTVSGGPYLLAGHWLIFTDKCITGKETIITCSSHRFTIRNTNSALISLKKEQPNNSLHTNTHIPSYPLVTENIHFLPRMFRQEYVCHCISLLFPSFSHRNRMTTIPYKEFQSTSHQ